MIKEIGKIVGGKPATYYEFDSMHEFNEYINNTPLNSIYRWRTLASTTSSESFTATRNFEQASELFKSGWDSMAKQLEEKLQLIANEVQPKQTIRSTYDVAGFQASVPRYLQGIPTSMVNQKRIAQKQKVITINKDIYYNCRYSTQEIIEYSTKALQIVKKVEAQGYRVNLNILFAASTGHEGQGERIMFKVRVKSASERLNVAKTAFALVHPSMIRRIMFRALEVAPDMKDERWPHGYGYPLGNRGPAELQIENELLLPLVINNTDEIIKEFNLR